MTEAQSRHHDAQVAATSMWAQSGFPASPPGVPETGVRREGSQLIRSLLCALLVCCIPGCNYFILLGYLIGGPPQLEPQFEKETNKSMTDKDVRVAVVCFAPNDLKYQFDNIDHILASRISMQLSQNKIEVVHPDEVRLWLEKNPEWDTADEVGAAFDVRYVIHIDISDFSLYERDSGANLYRGRCEAIISVYEMKTDGSGRRIFSQDLTSAFPTQVPRSSSDVSYESFRMEYFWRLSEEIGRMFYPYLTGDDMGLAN